jgi:acyl-CoA reductase-like NAD-dependent aldehyde dehydrogenase
VASQQWQEAVSVDGEFRRTLAPFGGIGRSGLGGRSGGDANIEEFTERRWLTVNTAPAHYPY